MGFIIPTVSALSLVTMAGCTETEPLKESPVPENPIVGDWSVSSLEGACYNMSWENGDTLEFCYEYPQFSFRTAEDSEGLIEVSGVEGEIHFLTIATYAGQEPSTQVAILEVIELRIEAIEALEETAEYIIRGDINEDGIVSEEYLTLDCSLTKANELECDLDEGTEGEEEDIFPDFSLRLHRL